MATLSRRARGWGPSRLMPPCALGTMERQLFSLALRILWLNPTTPHPRSVKRRAPPSMLRSVRRRCLPAAADDMGYRGASRPNRAVAERDARIGNRNLDATGTLGCVRLQGHQPFPLLLQRSIASKFQV